MSNLHYEYVEQLVINGIISFDELEALKSVAYAKEASDDARTDYE